MAQKRPNVIVFFTDQQRWDTTGVHGNPLDLTPNFDRLARAGTDVHYSITCQPVCGPARACLQTGMYATETGCYRNGIALPRDSRTLAHYFSDAGYDTAYIGKWHLSDEAHGPVSPEQRGGYDYWLASNLLEFTSDAYDMVMYDGDGAARKLPGYRVDAQTDAMIGYVNDHQERPFFLFSSFIEPHHQNHRDDYPPPVGYLERYRARWMPPDLAALGGSSHQHMAGYLGMIKRLDEALGRLVDALISLDMLEDTIILFTSDHGCHFKTRNAEYKRSCHDASVRVPTMLHGGPFTGGGRLSQMVSLLDLPPTLLDAVGIPVPERMSGRSILPLLTDADADWPDEVFIQISESQVGRAIRSRRWKYAAVAPHKDGWDDINSDIYHETELYDLLADPNELHNRAGCESHRGIADVLRSRLIRRMVEAGEDEPIIEPAPVQACAGQLSVELEEGWL
ncbi:MAG: sulfatase-like hydrolase/transferase [Chloroflexi bacterium]|nr:sulfatase-like hydrolase/transferase [Chloroflexota bacterium]